MRNLKPLGIRECRFRGDVLGELPSLRRAWFVEGAVRGGRIL